MPIDGYGPEDNPVELYNAKARQTAIPRQPHAGGAAKWCSPNLESADMGQSGYRPHPTPATPGSIPINLGELVPRVKALSGDAKLPGEPGMGES
jgi:hypothetical protein